MKKQQLEQREAVNTAWMLPDVPCWVQIATEDSDTFPDLFAPAKIIELKDTKLTVAYTKHEGLPSQVDTFQVFQQNIYEEANGVNVCNACSSPIWS
jgi:hypothetical protein